MLDRARPARYRRLPERHRARNRKAVLAGLAAAAGPVSSQGIPARARLLGRSNGASHDRASLGPALLRTLKRLGSYRLIHWTVMSAWGHKRCPLQWTAAGRFPRCRVGDQGRPVGAIGCEAPLPDPCTAVKICPDRSRRGEWPVDSGQASHPKSGVKKIQRETPWARSSNSSPYPST